MENIDKIKCVLIDFEINEITLQEATKRILLLLDVVGQSEQLECAYEGCSNHCKMPDKHGHCCDCQEDMKHTSN